VGPDRIRFTYTEGVARSNTQYRSRVSPIHLSSGETREDHGKRITADCEQQELLFKRSSASPGTGNIILMGSSHHECQQQASSTYLKDLSAWVVSHYSLPAQTVFQDLNLRKILCPRASETW
jgi:hypothetical protein